MAAKCTNNLTTKRCNFLIDIFLSVHGEAIKLDREAGLLERGDVASRDLPITSTCRGHMRADEKAEAEKTPPQKKPTDERARACKTKSAKEKKKKPTLARAHTLIKARTHKHTHTN